MAEERFNLDMQRQCLLVKSLLVEKNAKVHARPGGVNLVAGLLVDSDGLMIASYRLIPSFQMTIHLGLAAKRLGQPWPVFYSFEAGCRQTSVY